MSALPEIEERIHSLLAGEPYKLDADQHEVTLLALLKDELAYACERSLPVGIFKINPPLESKAVTLNLPNARMLHSGGWKRLQQQAITKDAFARGVAAALQGNGMESFPGVAFLRLWLRQGTSEPILERELGQEALNGGWREEGRAKLRAFPLGTVGHWPAGNIEIQPVLSLSCALLGGNGCRVR